MRERTRSALYSCTLLFRYAELQTPSHLIMQCIIPEPRHLLFSCLPPRGLRFKSGLDCGDVLARVHNTTGRMTYRGRVMNRAARIAGMATAGQVGGFKQEMGFVTTQ